MPLLIPKEIVREAEKFAEETVKEAIHGLYGFVEHELERRRSYEFAVEKALFHKKMVILLSSDRGNGLFDREGRIRRHKRRELRFSALAYARNPQLAGKCSLIMAC